jgi:RNA polymerase-binding transcription factor DksA
MTTSQRTTTARITVDKKTLATLSSRLEAERAAQAVLVGAPIPRYDQQASTGHGETDYISVETERQVFAALDVHARRALEDISSALARVEEGTYGHCSKCGGPIDEDRLHALPRARFCIVCKREDERR